MFLTPLANATFHTNLGLVSADKPHLPELTPVPVSGRDASSRPRLAELTSVRASAKEPRRSQELGVVDDAHVLESDALVCA